LNFATRALLLTALFAAGCTPKIGDKCNSSTDCSQLGERLCDVSQPNGYCTIFNCEPDTCPNSVCVGFNAKTDAACPNDGRWARFERTFCLKECSSNSDCRDSYVCVLQVDFAARNATPLDSSSPTGICMVAVSTPANPTTGAGDPGVCKPGDADAGWTPYATSASSSSSSSSSASSSSTTTSGGGAGGKGGAGGAGAGGKGGAGGV
jgi:hypothetical protein